MVGHSPRSGRSNCACLRRVSQPLVSGTGLQDLKPFVREYGLFEHGKDLTKPTFFDGLLASTDLFSPETPAELSSPLGVGDAPSGRRQAEASSAVERGELE